MRQQRWPRRPHQISGDGTIESKSNVAKSGSFGESDDALFRDLVDGDGAPVFSRLHHCIVVDSSLPLTPSVLRARHPARLIYCYLDPFCRCLRIVEFVSRIIWFPISTRGLVPLTLSNGLPSSLQRFACMYLCRNYCLWLSNVCQTEHISHCTKYVAIVTIVDLAPHERSPSQSSPKCCARHTLEEHGNTKSGSRCSTYHQYEKQQSI